MRGWVWCLRSLIEVGTLELHKHANPLVRRVDALFPDHCAFPVGRRASFRGLSACDTAVLCEAIAADGKRPEAWWVEAPVGDLPEWAVGGNAPAWWKDFAWQYQLRADLVQVRGQDVFVTEIKSEIRPSAVGQVLTYTYLLQRQLGADVPVHPALLGRSCLREVRDLCGDLGLFVRTLDEVK